MNVMFIVASIRAEPITAARGMTSVTSAALWRLYGLCTPSFGLVGKPTGLGSQDSSTKRQKHLGWLRRNESMDGIFSPEELFKRIYPEGKGKSSNYLCKKTMSIRL